MTRVRRHHVHDLVAVVPVPHRREVPPVPLAQGTDLSLGEAGVASKLARKHHGILREHVERRVPAILLYGQDARHVGESDVGLVLQPIAQEVEELDLTGPVVWPLTERGVPLVDHDYELGAGGLVEPAHAVGQVIAVVLDCRIRLAEFAQDPPRQRGKTVLDRPSRPNEIRHDQPNGIKGTKAAVPGNQSLGSLPRGAGGEFRSLEQRANLGSPVVIGTHHVCRHGLSEPARARDTHVFLLCVHQVVQEAHHLGLVDEDLGLTASSKPCLPGSRYVPMPPPNRWYSSSILITGGMRSGLPRTVVVVAVVPKSEVHGLANRGIVGGTLSPGDSVRREDPETSVSARVSTVHTQRRTFPCSQRLRSVRVCVGDRYMSAATDVSFRGQTPCGVGTC